MNLFNVERSFKMKSEHRWPEVYFCIDLHGTIIPSGKSSSDNKDNLKFYPHAKDVLRWMNSRKDIITILWTSTPIERLGKVTSWLAENDIVFTYINENPHAKNTERSVFDKKFYFSILLDDRAGFEPQTDWFLIKQELKRIGEWQCSHVWGTDGVHSNIFCKLCFESKK